MKLRQMRSRRAEEAEAIVPKVHIGPVKRKAPAPGTKEEYVRSKLEAMRIDKTDKIWLSGKDWSLMGYIGTSLVVNLYEVSRIGKIVSCFTL